MALSLLSAISNATRRSMVSFSSVVVVAVSIYCVMSPESDSSDSGSETEEMIKQERERRLAEKRAAIGAPTETPSRVDSIVPSPTRYQL